MNLQILSETSQYFSQDFWTTFISRKYRASIRLQPARYWKQIALICRSGLSPVLCDVWCALQNDLGTHWRCVPKAHVLLLSHTRKCQAFLGPISPWFDFSHFAYQFTWSVIFHVWRTRFTTGLSPTALRTQPLERIICYRRTHQEPDSHCYIGSCRAASSQLPPWPEIVKKVTPFSGCLFTSRRQ